MARRIRDGLKFEYICMVFKKDLDRTKVEEFFVLPTYPFHQWHSSQVSRLAKKNVDGNCFKTTAWRCKKLSHCDRL